MWGLLGGGRGTSKTGARGASKGSEVGANQKKIMLINTYENLTNPITSYITFKNQLQNKRS